jgi:glyoxalase family protein
MSVHSIHHVTAVTAEIVSNKEFYTKTLGLRLVKKSVNQDDVSAYHLFYADRVGSPGTDMTFFDWPQSGPTNPGAGTVALTSFRVPPGSLDWWESRLKEFGPMREKDEFDEERLLFTDPEGQRLELTENSVSTGPSVPWTEEVSLEHAICGIVGVDLESARPDSTKRVLQEILGFRTANGSTFELRSEGRYARVRVIDPLSGRFGRVGAGGVHHVAFRVGDEAELLKMQRMIEMAGLRTSGEIDRFYFKSLYFREPGGILFELATEGPGFATDEDAAHLGENLALPPFLEERREEIEAGLKPLQ